MFDAAGVRRNVGRQASILNKILDDMVELLQPKYMQVLADFNQRGNIHTKVIARHGKKNEDA